jgi:2,4-dienoyl-CoA reductase-like NADH-dependent reductase (Old Yellow Enzyme family)/thioredoxin reductase
VQPLRFMNQALEKGNLHLKNRFVMPPMVTHYATSEGSMTERQIAYYAARAEGGVGLIIVEAATVSPEGKGSTHWLCLHDDSFILPLTKLTKIANSNGTKILIQLAHAGRQTFSQCTGAQPVAPSAVPCDSFAEVPRELSFEEIKIIERKFADAARRAHAAGFDGVEIHGAHGYLIHQFLSPRTNHRSDNYGGGLSCRTNFLIEVLEEVKRVVPSDFIIGCRLNSEDYVNEGLHIEDTKRIATQLASHGISYLHISCGVAESIQMTIPPMDVEPGFLVPFAETIKKTVSVPVIAVGRIVDPLQADDIIGQGRADLVSMGRALWADPYLPRKALQGRLDEIRPCIGCNQGCRKIIDRCCLMNPESGREMEFKIYPAKESKRVLVIGGGPAAMEFSRVASLRGHKITIFERSTQLGGNLRLASICPKRAEILRGVQYFDREIRRLGVQVQTEKEVTPEDLREFQFDELIIATGAVPLIPSIPGIEQDNVISAEDVLLEKKLIGNRVLVIGGGLVGCELADFLSSKGKKVILMEMLPSIASDMDPPSAVFLHERLQKQGVIVQTSCRVMRIINSDAVIEKDGAEEIVGSIDSVILATGNRSNRDLVDRLKPLDRPIHLIGDALEPRDALWAMYEGSKVAREI